MAEPNPKATHIPVEECHYREPRYIRRRRLLANMYLRQQERRRGRVAASAMGEFHRRFYQAVPLNRRQPLQDEPAVAIKAFSPCGRYLIAFARMPMAYAVHIYRFHFAGYAKLQQDQPIFERFFTRLHTVTVSPGHTWLVREVYLFCRGSRYLIVATSSELPAQNSVHAHHRHPALRGAFSTHENVTFHVIDVQQGIVVDQVTFEDDVLNLRAENSVYVHNNRLCIVSLRHQNIHVFHVRETGTLLPLFKIGDFCFDDDRFYLATSAPDLAPPDLAPSSQQAEAEEHEPLLPDSPSSGDLMQLLTPQHDQQQQAQPRRDPEVISSFKQRLLAFLYRQAASIKEHAARRQSLRRFYLFFTEYLDLAIFRGHFISDRIMVIHLVPPHLLKDAGKNERTISTGKLVFYDVFDTSVIRVMDHDSQTVCSLLDSHALRFWHASTASPGKVSSPQNSSCSRNHAYQAMENYHKSSGSIAPSKHPKIPSLFQTGLVSPYADEELFAYSQDMLPFCARPRHGGEKPFRVFSRSSGSHSFTINANLENDANGDARCATQILLHPWLPFAITNQVCWRSGPPVTFHMNVIYHDSGGMAE